MSKTAWCDLNNKGDILKLHDKCANPNCKCQTLITFTPKQIQLEGNRLKNTIGKKIQGSQTAGNKIL